MELLVLISCAVLAAGASALPEVPIQQYGAPDSAPYPPSGWRPQGRQFFLPVSSRNAGLYQPPPQQYGPPPAPTTTEAAETTTTELPTTTESVEGARSQALREPLASDAETGVYYVLQPDGRLQRVAYAHGPAAATSPLLSERLTASPVPVDPGYLARFHYQDLLPQGAPVFAYRQAGPVRIF